MKKKKSTKRLFYRNAPYLESLVFAPPKVAEYNSAIHHALVASTWGEFKAIIPVKEYKPLLQRLREGQYYLETDDAHDADKHHTLPQSNEPFDPEFWFPGFGEGDYPDWLQQKQDLWLPSSQPLRGCSIYPMPPRPTYAKLSGQDSRSIRCARSCASAP
jgi:hypothetical protein